MGRRLASRCLFSDSERDTFGRARLAIADSVSVHDLRATGATWMAVRGDDPPKIKQRCGHSTFSTTEVYICEAEAVRGVGETPLKRKATAKRPRSREGAPNGMGARPAGV